MITPRKGPSWRSLGPLASLTPSWLLTIMLELSGSYTATCGLSSEEIIMPIGLNQIGFN